jgi:hypothetical protein
MRSASKAAVSKSPSASSASVLPSQRHSTGAVCRITWRAQSYRRPPLDPARCASVRKASSLANREISLAALPRGSVLATEA